MTGRSNATVCVPALVIPSSHIYLTINIRKHDVYIYLLVSRVSMLRVTIDDSGFETSSPSTPAFNHCPLKVVVLHLHLQCSIEMKHSILFVFQDPYSMAGFHGCKSSLLHRQSALPQSNIGFKMLKQMGYTPGSGLGGSGRVEPVGLEIRRSRAAIGREDPIKEKLRKEEKLVRENKMKEEELMADFGCRVKERWRIKRVVVNFHKAKGVLDQLENKEVVEVEKKDDDDDEGEDEEEEVITEEDLHEMLMKLRDNFQYCLFCGCQMLTRIQNII